MTTPKRKLYEGGRGDVARGGRAGGGSCVFCVLVREEEEKEETEVGGRFLPFPPSSVRRGRTPVPEPPGPRRRRSLGGSLCVPSLAVSHTPLVRAEVDGEAAVSLSHNQVTHQGWWAAAGPQRNGRLRARLGLLYLPLPLPLLVLGGAHSTSARWWWEVVSEPGSFLPSKWRPQFSHFLLFLCQRARRSCWESWSGVGGWRESESLVGSL